MAPKFLFNSQHTLSTHASQSIYRDTFVLFFTRQSSTFERSDRTFHLYIPIKRIYLETAGENVLTSHAPSIEDRSKVASSGVARKAIGCFTDSILQNEAGTVTRTKMDRTFEVAWEVILEARKHHRAIVFLSVARRDGESHGTAVEQRRTNSCQSVRGLVLADPLLYDRPLPVMLWLLMYSVHDVYSRRATSATTRRKSHASTGNTMCVCLPI